MNNRTIIFTAGLILVWIIGYLLIIGRNILIPLVIAIFIWHLLNTAREGVQRIHFRGVRPPYWLSMVLALLIFAILIKILVNIISNNVHEVIAAAPRYQDHLNKILSLVDQRFHVKALMTMDQFMKNLSVQGILVNIYAVFSTIMSSAVLITLYVAFLFVEQHFISQKLNALFPQKEHRSLVNNIIIHIVNDTQIYLGLKTLLSLITATMSWIIMRLVGLDFAEFWALLIFFLDFIPNIGAIIATAFPAVLALVQFESWWPFIIITSGLVIIQFIVGNIIEPRFLGKSLNLSPLVILLALALWGAVWGILGMFLSVPITVMMMIIFAHFEPTRPLAIMLSQDGQIKKAYEAV
ncbi:transporter, permease [Legionella nautarum]|uniref:Transporter, permease n=1 Tax=Legionella nautarum TaxID=45070 RepID=A0A0W0WN29_9GAMM|nr:AI-2E family transporter [Legionella nautarum]KTD33724.1 transporter, permease [Legionella nautarum]